MIEHTAILIKHTAITQSISKRKDHKDGRRIVDAAAGSHAISIERHDDVRT